MENRRNFPPLLSNVPAIHFSSCNTRLSDSLEIFQRILHNLVGGIDDTQSAFRSETHKTCLVFCALLLFGDLIETTSEESSSFWIKLHWIKLHPNQNKERSERKDEISFTNGDQE